MQLSTKQKYEIILRRESGQTTVKIAEEMNVSRKTVSKWINRYKLDYTVFLQTSTRKQKIL